MKRIIVGIVCMISMITKAQETTETFNKFQLGVSFSPDYNRIIELTGQNVSESKIGYTTGINTIYNLNKNFGVELGVQYANKGLKISTQLFKTNSYLINNINFIDIPLKLNYTIGKNKLKFLSSLGVTTNLYLNNVVKLYDVDNNYTTTKIRSKTINSICLSYYLSLGIGYTISSKTIIKIEPTFRYSIFSQEKNEINNIKILNPGLNIGYYYSL